MRFRFLIMCVVIATLSISGTAVAQTSASNLTGRVIYENDGMPGVTVIVTSPALQGQKVTTTNALGGYIFKSLPPGEYKVRFGLADFTTLEYDVKMSTAQARTLDAIMYPEAMEEEIVVTSSFETVSTGAQGSATVEQALLEKLPVLRTLDSAVLLNAGTSGTGPYGNISISGAASWESLYTLNGMVLNENLRGAAYDLFIEDALLETTTITSSASAEYGRFAGGVVNAVSKSGGNQFSGSFRVNMTNESWNGETPLTTGQEDTNNYIYEATFGGYIVRDKLWFFAAGRDQDLTYSGQIFIPSGDGETFPRTESETRLEAKVTGSITPNHRVSLGYIDSDFEETNDYYPWGPPADWGALSPGRQLPNTAWNVNYTGVMTDNFFVEALYSEREFQFIGGGGVDPTVGGGTPVYDYLDYALINAPWFCGICPPETRANENVWAKASWFFSGGGTHDLVFGVDAFNDIRQADNWQTSSGYNIYTWTPQDYSTPGSPLLHIVEYDYIIWSNVETPSQGNEFKTNSLFVNDTWRISDRFTVNLGLRYDANDGTDQGGAKITDDSRISPRLSASWDVKGDGSIVVNGGLSRYVVGMANGVADSGSQAGDPYHLAYWYVGPDIIAGTDEYPTNGDAIEGLVDWFINDYGGHTNQDLYAWGGVPGLSPRVARGLASPYGDEATLGASFRLGTRGVVRADWVYRDYGDFYVSTTVPNRSATDDLTGITVDVAEFINYNEGLERKYNALMARFDYRVGSRWNLGANYTWSETKGNNNTENAGSGPVANGILDYEEYQDPSWNRPMGLLSTDQTHKFNGWVSWDAISSNRNNLNISLLQSFLSGTPYQATQSIDTTPYAPDSGALGYVNDPPYMTYFFSGRGAFRTDDVSRTDLAINYSFFINIGGGQLEVFIQPEVINIFNESAVMTVNASVNGPRQGMEAFDPFTETPVEGVNWEYGSSFGEAQGADDYQLPRTFRLSFGLRF
ncbi:MAG: TonB-dependent receptor [Acidobacteria bacterium]|nr:TonB-dependent receptor [Candidatus Sulfomarinibacter kjeldsenii]